MSQADQRHLDWLARSLGRDDYRPLRPADIEVVQQLAEAIVLAPGLHLFDEGAKAPSAFLIDQGHVDVIRGGTRKERTVARSGPGSIHGDFAMFGDRGHIATLRATTAVRTYRLDRSRLLPGLSVQPGILVRWLVAMAMRTEETQRRLLHLMDKNALAQVATLLVEESELQPDIDLTQATIGGLLGITRQSVNEALGRLRDDGLVATGYRNIEVLDRDGLVAIAEG